MTAVRELFSCILSELGRMVCGDEVQEHYFMWKLTIRSPRPFRVPAGSAALAVIPICLWVGSTQFSAMCCS